MTIQEWLGGFAELILKIIIHCFNQSGDITLAKLVVINLYGLEPWFIRACKPPLKNQQMLFDRFFRLNTGIHGSFALNSIAILTVGNKPRPSQQPDDRNDNEEFNETEAPVTVLLASQDLATKMCIHHEQISALVPVCTEDREVRPVFK